jgi:hypothetical protein
MRSLSIFSLCVFLVSCQSRKPALLHIDPVLESLVPDDTVFVVGANVDAVRNTTVYQKLLSRVPVPQLEEFTQRTGLESKDFSQILACSNGKNAVLMVKGKFNRADLEERLERNGAPSFAYKNHHLFGNDNQAIAFLNDSTALAGRTNEIEPMLDGRKTAGLPQTLRDLLRTLPQNDQIYAALTGGLAGLNLSAPPNSNLAQIMQALKSVNTATLGMDLTKGFDLIAAVNCNNQGDARFVHDLLKGVIGLGRLNTPSDKPELLKLYDAIQVTQQQTHAEVKADISQDLADKFLDLWLKR